MLKDIKITPLIETIKFLEISDEEYFSEAYSDYISNSRLKLINPEQGGSPEAYLAGLGADGRYSDSLYFGSAVHELVLQPESFILVESVDRPTAKAGFMADELYPLFIANGVVTKDEIVAASDKINYYKGKWMKIKWMPYASNARTIMLNAQLMSGAANMLQIRFQFILMLNLETNYENVLYQLNVIHKYNPY